MFFVLIVIIAGQGHFLANFATKTACEDFRSHMAPIYDQNGNVLETRCVP